MNVVVNGRPTTLDGTTTIASLVERLGRDPAGRGVAVAVNGEVVPRVRWTEATLADADRVEVLGAIGGG